MQAIDRLRKTVYSNIKKICVGEVKGEKLMHENERIVIDTRKYSVDEVFERYMRGLLVFYKKSNVARTRKDKVTREVLGALSKGIPFPPVYVSEQQTGELLVLDKSDRLRFLMECLESNHVGYYIEKRLEKNIFYSSVILHVIEYINPKYMHMQVGAFIEEWSAIQEQSVRNILYQGVEMEIAWKLISDMHYSFKSELNLQYNFIYFIMTNFILFDTFDYSQYQDADKFQLMEKTIYELRYQDYSFLKELSKEFEALYCLIYQRENVYRYGGLFSNYSVERGTKYLCFMSAWNKIRGEYFLEEMSRNKRIKEMVINCDMSYESISRVLEDFRRGNL